MKKVNIVLKKKKKKELVYKLLDKVICLED